MFLCVTNSMHLIHVTLGNLSLREWTQDVHKLDGFPTGVVLLLLCRERTEGERVPFQSF